MSGVSPSTLLLRPVDQLDYYDCRSVDLAAPVTALEAWNLMRKHPQPLMRVAFQIRDAISSKCGVKRIGGFSEESRQEVDAGEKLDFFRVERCAPDLLILTERDKHLDVMISLSIAKAVLTITSSVVVHNLFGRIYMIPVGLVHGMIVRRDLKNLQKALI